MYLRPPTRTRIGMAVGTKVDTKMAEGRSRSSKTRHNARAGGGGAGAAKGFYVGSMGSTRNTTPINALRRSRRSWSGKLRRRRRQRAWL
jgi:hypothetical protein